jgi:hypothetical protein
MSLAAIASFAVLAANPIGGLAIAIPYAVLTLHLPVWIAVAAGIPLAYVQVVVVDVLWNSLSRWPAWHRVIERRRHSPRVQRLIESRGGFWATMLLAPLVGPWLVMALMRYVRVPHRRVALPIALGLTWNAVAIALLSITVPRLFAT